MDKISGRSAKMIIHEFKSQGKNGYDICVENDELAHFKNLGLEGKWVDHETKCNNLGIDHYFYRVGGGGGYHLWDLETIFFLKKCGLNNFFHYIL